MDGENVDPTNLFDLGRVLNPDGPHGTVVRAAVADGVRKRIDASSVAVKIVPVGERVTTVLRSTVNELRSNVQHAALVRYHGVWSGPGGEAWIVSDLCEVGSVPDVLSLAGVTEPGTRERIVAYVIRNVLLALDSLHASGRLHGDVRAQNFLVDGRGRVKVADYGVFHILEAAMRLRVSYPGARLWPAPELSSGRAYDAASEIWALGIATMELIEGRASVSRAYQVATNVPPRGRSTGGGGGGGGLVNGGGSAVGSGGGGGVATSVAGSSSSVGIPTPSLRDGGRWSPRLHGFIAGACASSPSARLSAAQLLATGFIVVADGSALGAAADAAAMRPTPARLAAAYDVSDAAAALHRRNNAVRMPLLDLRAMDGEEFIRAEPHARGVGDDKPAVEVALRVALESRRRRAEFVGDETSAEAECTARISGVLETIDMARRNR